MAKRENSLAWIGMGIALLLAWASSSDRKKIEQLQREVMKKVQPGGP